MYVVRGRTWFLGVFSSRVKVMDARDMADFENESFDAVIDKGMTDSVMYNDKFSVMMAKVSRPVVRRVQR